MARRRRTKRHRHHFGSSILYKILSVVIISAAIVAALVMFFKVSTIQVSGVTKYSEEEIIAASGIEVGDNLFLLNEYEIYDSIIEKLPYVSSVSISRVFPSGVVIEVTGKNQGGILTYGHEYWVMSSRGDLLGKRAEPGSGARILGIDIQEPRVGAAIDPVEEDERKVTELLALLDALEEKGMLTGVKQMNFTEDSVISMDYADRFHVILLYGADYTYKLTQLSAVIEKLEQQGDLREGTVDLTHEGRVHFIPD